MSQKQFIVVAYDISNDKRRTRLHERLKDFGYPVQYSVFECLLDQDGKTRMIATVRKTVRPRLDHVRVYTLCANCRENVLILGPKETLHEPPVLVV